VALVALVVLVVVALVIAVGVHTGPHGLVAAGTLGIAASIGFVIGIIALAPTGTRTFVAWFLLAATGLISAGAVVAGAVALPALRRRQSALGTGGLYGAEGVALTALTPKGTVRVRGETWTAESVNGQVPAGAPVHVMEIDGLRLRVWSDAVMPDELHQAAGDEEKT
jgi:membrane-bound ClpP family serine protease